MRELKGIVVHGSWTKSGIDVGVDEIREWHTAEPRGWSDIGYHFVIRRSGLWEVGRPIETAGAHVAGHNADTVGICLVGGREDDTVETAGLPEEAKQELQWEFNYTSQQLLTLIDKVGELRAEYPSIEYVQGHRDFDGVSKRCPGFDVREFFSA